MKKFIILVLILLLTFSLTGCKSPTEMIGEKVGEKIVESALGGNVDIDGDKVTVKGEDGSELTFGTTEWPKDLLGNEIPKLNDGKIAYVANSDVMCMITVEEIKQSEHDDYLGKIKNAGFTENVASFSDASTSSYIAGNSEGISLQLTYNSETKELSIVAGKEEKPKQ